jgi:hypothetical protein
LYTNYFGVMNGTVREVKKKFGNVIIDNSQAFFARPLRNVPTFYSPRKFFGLPDGGFAYSKGALQVNGRKETSIDRFRHLLQRIEQDPESAYNLFKSNEARLNNLPIRRMSTLTHRLMRNIDFKRASRQREENFRFLHNHLKNLNEFSGILERGKINGPMVYPFLRKGNTKLRRKLIKNRIYVATYWPNVYDLVKRNSWEHYLADNLIPIPVDQRYSIPDMGTILHEID